MVQVALVTGGASGIGKATSIALAKKGISVAIGDIQQKQGEAVAESIKASGGQALFIHLDVTDEASWSSAVAETAKAFGGLTILVNNAGVGGQPTRIEDLSLESYEKTLKITGTSVFLGCKHASAELAKHPGQAAVVNIASVMSSVSSGLDPIFPAYAAAKGACAILTKNIATAWAPKGIRVNSVHPGYIDTPILDVLSVEDKQAIIAKHPIGRLGRPEEIADAVVFLSSMQASFITGTSLFVDGGYTAV